MEIVFYSGLLLIINLHSIQADDLYDIHELESFSFCSHGREEASIYIRPWKAAIFKLGYSFAEDGSQASEKIHRCKVAVNTAKGFGLAAVIEDMKIQAARDLETNSWICKGDYVKLSTAGESFISRVLDSLLPGNLFKSKSTQELCGTRNPSSGIFLEIGTNANVLSTLASQMELEFHQRVSRDQHVNNSFTIVVTTFKHDGKQEDCQGKYKCRGNEAYCINEEFLCDGHYNCAFPHGGADELNCKVATLYHPIFSTTSLIITTLASIVGLGLVVCCIFTIVMRIRSRNTTRASTPVPPAGLSSDPTAPPLQRQHTLPRYEAVVMSDIGQNWKGSAAPTPDAGEFPPSYQALFPNGPPKADEFEKTEDAATKQDLAS